MAEAFNVHFTNIANTAARDIPVGKVDAESFLSSSDNPFCLKTPIHDVLLDLLKKNRWKESHWPWHEIPSKSLKMAASIVVPSLTDIFTKSVFTGIYPTDHQLEIGKGDTDL